MAADTGGRSPYNLLAKAAENGGQGHSSFKKLCKEGCDRRILNSRLVWLIPPQKITLESKAKAPTYEDQRAKRDKLITFYFPPRESLEEISHPITWRMLNSIVNRFHDDLVLLRRTRLVRTLVLDGTLADDPLLGGPLPIPLLSKFRPEALQGIVALPELARELGQRRRPEYRRYLKAVYRHIFECTGKWHDREVADILNDLRRPHPKQLYTQENLKRWRSLHHVRP
jgi:hypothetical protein